MLEALDVKPAGVPSFSPTAISTWLECPRKWGWRYIARIVDPPNASAQLGSRVHKVLEEYLRDGKAPDHVDDLQAAKIASTSLHLLPAPKTPGMGIEQNFAMRSTRTGFVYFGLKDVDLAPGVFLDACLPGVIDHKTSGDIAKYAKTPDDLLFDPQSTIYTLDTVVRWGTDACVLSWHYMQTKKTLRAEPRRLRAEREHFLRVFEAIERVAEDAENARATQDVLSLPPNPSACSGFGGCPHQARCNLSATDRLRAKMANPLISSLRKQVQGASVEEKVLGEGITAAVITPPESKQLPFPAINPPESALEPELLTKAPAQEKVEETKIEEAPKRRGRPRKVDASVAAEAFKTGYVLFVDCLPVGTPVTSIASFVGGANAAVQEVYGVPDYRLVDYRKGDPLFAARLVELLLETEPLQVVLDTRSAEASLVIEALTAKAMLVVRGTR